MHQLLAHAKRFTDRKFQLQFQGNTYRSSFLLNPTDEPGTFYKVKCVTTKTEKSNNF